MTVTGHVTLIPWFGLLGAATATAAGQAARVVVMTVAAQRLYHIPYETGRLLRTALAGLVVYAASGFAPADISAEALVVRVGLLAAFPLALLAAGVRGSGRAAAPAGPDRRARRTAVLRAGRTGVSIARASHMRSRSRDFTVIATSHSVGTPTVAIRVAAPNYGPRTIRLSRGSMSSDSGAG